MPEEADDHAVAETDVSTDLPDAPFEFDQTTLDEFDKLLAIGDPDARLRVHRELGEIANDYLRWLAQKSETPSRSQTAAQLRRLGKDSATLAAEIRSLDGDALFEMMMRLDRYEDTGTAPDPIPGRIRTLVDELEVFAHVAEKARNATSELTGPNRNNDLALAVIRLVGLYERITEEQATHTPSKSGLYDGTPRSRAGRFMLAFFTAVNERVSKGEQVSVSALSSTLAKYIRTQNNRTKTRRVPPARST